MRLEAARAILDLDRVVGEDVPLEGRLARERREVHRERVHRPRALAAAVVEAEKTPAAHP